MRDKVARAFLPEGKAKAESPWEYPISNKEYPMSKCDALRDCLAQRRKGAAGREYPISNKEYPMSKLNALRGIGWAGGRASPRAARNGVFLRVAKGEALPYHSAGQRPVYGAYNKIKAESLASFYSRLTALNILCLRVVGRCPTLSSARPLALCLVPLERLKALGNIQQGTFNVQVKCASVLCPNWRARQGTPLARRVANGAGSREGIVNYAL